MIETLATGIAAAGSLLALGGLGLELNYRLLPRGNKLELTAGEWHLAINEPNHYLLVGEMEFR
ncbi:MAG TPA: F420-0:Gamma-glutamyl ligase, partial [Microcoleaceae bacterium UBA10368]|nr:F420-0:Gamma-glutamyl ligase [Microcoleaceae cyanobacterium UBA10368]